MVHPSPRWVFIALIVPALLFGQVNGDPPLPEYHPAKGLAGILKSVGSDTKNLEMTLWSEGFLELYPNVRAEIEGKGSATAPPALLAGKSDLAPMNRPMTDKEIDQLKQKYGYAPTALPTSLDMLAVYVHKDNPIKGLTLPQLDAVFSRTRKGGLKKRITTWSDLGLGGAWADKPIVLYGRNSVSGTYAFFKEHVLLNGDFKREVHEESGSAALVQAITDDRFAIGYSGIGYKTEGVRAVPLARGPASPFVPAETAHAHSGDYPLARRLILYVNHQPGSKLEPLRREFLRYIFSKQGQLDVARSGYLPIGEKTARQALKSVGVEPATGSSDEPGPAPRPGTVSRRPTAPKTLVARDGFALREDAGRWWVFRTGSKPLNAFDREGPPEQHVTRLHAASFGVTLKAPDLATLEEYLATEPGFVCKYETGRLWIFRAGSKDLAEYQKNGELAKHVTRPRAGPRGLSLKSPDADTLDAYQKLRRR
jgi:phosphate transport system substrate-binding protein